MSELDVTNDQRAEWGRPPLDLYIKNTGLTNDDYATGLADLLADLMHLCDKLAKEGVDIDWEREGARAYSFYVDELREEREGL